MDRKVALVTGSAKGIGKATITEFAKRGYNVVINFNSNKKKAQELKDFAEKEYGAQALVIKANVASESDVVNMFSTIMAQFGRIDALVNNAGIVFDRPFEEIKIEEFEQTLKTNVIGAFIVAREASKYMKKGAIVNISSTNGTKTISPECLDYNVSKVGLQSLTRDLAYQLKPNIRVNAVAIGWADTDMNKDLTVEQVSEYNKKILLGRFAEAKEIAKVVIFLASNKASYVNDSIIRVDGGKFNE